MAIGNVGAAVPMNDPSHLMSSQTQTQEAVSPNLPNTASTLVEISPAAISLSKEAQVKSPLTSEKADSEAAGGVKSFAYGALGMDHPDKVDTKEDDSYTAGQFLKAAATVGSVIALFI